jgi:hypothetical protein
MSDLAPIWWARLNRLGERVTALELKDQRPSPSVGLPRTILDWYEFIKFIEKLAVWALPRIILPAWGFIQSAWPWLRDIGFPAVRGWLGL